MKKTWITSAHQGYVEGNMRSNTVEAVRLAIARGAEMIETDARMTRDGVLIANHDATVVGVDANGARVEKEIATSTYAELKEIVLSESEAYGVQRIATLEEMLRVTHDGGIKINIDLKEGFRNAETIARLAVSCGMGGRTVYAPNGSGLATIFAVLAIDPEACFIDTPWNFNAETLKDYADYRARCFAYTADFSDANIRAIRESGCRLAAISLNAATAPAGLSLSPDMAEYPHTSDFVAIERDFFAGHGKDRKPMKTEQLLNGIWDYRVGKGAFGTVEVPFSSRPVGHSECVRHFDLEETAPRTFLRFDGINYEATVTLNGKTLGKMLPYCTYIYDVTDTVKEKDNLLFVALEDISPVFGPSEGWENYGGIPRTVRLLFREPSYITDVAFDATLENGYTAATMNVTVSGKGDARDVCDIRLYDGRRLVARYRQKLGETVPVSLPSVTLWSPDDPHLYRLVTTLIHDGKAVDRDSRFVGFREFRTAGRRFSCNGKPIFLTGVCYHEFYGEKGHLVDPAQTERDFRMMKKMGCNYVRLVHYPHNRETLDIADRIGLFVSEEPGLWWSDTALPENHNGSIEVLRRTIRRDRTHPSIAFWLCFNECQFTEQFLVDAARACREADPTRLVSGANCMSLEDTPTYFKLCGFDFYTMHPYSATPQRMIDSIKALSDLPLMFTEWGGYYVTDNPHLFTDFADTITAAWRESDDGDVLTGASYWCFADIYEWNRQHPACKEGILREGLVDPLRRPNAVYQAFVDAFARLSDRPTEEEKFGAEPLAPAVRDPLPLPAADEAAYAKLIADCRRPVERYVHGTKRNRKTEVGPRLREDRHGLCATPRVVCDGDSVTVPVGKRGKTLTLVCAGGPFTYPIGGAYGETVAEMTVRYEDGGEERLPLRSGVEIATVFETYGPSRIRPVAERATPYLRFHYDRNHEVYLLQRVDLPLDGTRAVREIAVTDGGTGSHFLLYAVALG